MHCLAENQILSRREHCMDKHAIERPEPPHDARSCINCGERMWPSCTEMDKPGFAHHVYECK